MKKERRGVLPVYYRTEMEGQERVHMVKLFFIGLQGALLYMGEGDSD